MASAEGTHPTPSSPRSPPDTVQLSPSLLQEQKLLKHTAYRSGWELFPKHLSIRHQERDILGTGIQEGPPLQPGLFVCWVCFQSAPSRA